MKKTILIIAILLCFTAQAALTDDLTSYYDLNQANTTPTQIHDMSGNGYHGLIRNSLYVNQTGYLDEGIMMNASFSDQHLFIENNTGHGELCFNGCTISAWVNNEAGHTGQDHEIVSNWNNTIRNYLLNLDAGATNNAQFRVSYNGTDTCMASSSGSVGWGSWVHVVGTLNYTSKVLTVYVNGVSSGSNDCSANPWNNSLISVNSNTYVGVRNESGALRKEFYGSIDEIGMWNRTLSSTEVTSLYNSGLALNPITNDSLPRIFNITLLEEDTETSMSGTTVTVEIIHADYSHSNTTSTGSIEYDDLATGSITIRTSAAGYEERIYTHTLASGYSYDNVTIYMLPTNQSTNVTATVYDQIGDIVEGAVIRVQKYDIDSNSYLQTEKVTTNQDGEANLHLTLNTEFYKFVLEYPEDTVKITTVPTYIYSNTINFQINIGEEFGSTFYAEQDVSHSLTYNNNTRTFQCIVVDEDTTTDETCLKIEQIGITTTVINQSCNITQGSITILLSHTNQNQTYRGTCYSTLASNGAITTWDSITIRYGDEFPLSSYAFFLVLILTMIVVFIGAWNWSIALAISPGILALSSYLGLIAINQGIIMGIWALFLLAAYIGGRN